MKQHLFYKATGPAGHEYIGYTGRTVAARWKDHITDAQKGRGYYLHRAIRKHGEEGWIVEEIHREICTNRQACAIEKRLIAEHGTFTSKVGLNMTPGGDGGDVNSKKSAEEKKAIYAKVKNTKLQNFGTLGWTPARRKAWEDTPEEIKQELSRRKSETLRAKSEEHGEKVKAGHAKRSATEKVVSGAAIGYKVKQAFDRRRCTPEWNQYRIGIKERLSKKVKTPFGTFSSLKEAVEKTGIPSTTLRRKIKDAENPDFQYVC